MFRAIVFAALILPIAACNRPDSGTSIAINGDDGNMLGSVNGKTGEVKIDVPGFQGSVKLPKIQFDAGNFDLNGVKLYPGSTIENVNVSDGKSGDGGVKVRFTSPATPAAVRGWFQERLTKVGYTVQSDGQKLVGTTDENKRFRLDLTPTGADKASGTIVIGD